MDSKGKEPIEGGIVTSNLENRIKDAFDAVAMPAGLKEDTLKAIALRRRKEQEQATWPQPAEVTPPRTQLPSREQGQATHAYPQPQPFTVASGSKRPRCKPVLARTGIFLAAACLLVAVLGFGGYRLYATETAFVGVEVNPSLEFGVNRFDIVINAWANNPEGQGVLDDVSLIGKSYDDALQTLLGSDAFLAYVDDASFVDISIVCNDDRQYAALVQNSETRVNALPCEGACRRASAEEHQAASEAGMGIRRYEAAQALMQLDPDIRLEDCQSMGMREIRQRITQLDPDSEHALQGSNGQGSHHQGSNSGAHRGNGSGNHN